MQVVNGGRRVQMRYENVNVLVRGFDRVTCKYTGSESATVSCVNMRPYHVSLIRSYGGANDDPF